MPSPKDKSYTVGEMIAIDDEQRRELIDGVIYDMSAPSSIHQDILGGMYADTHVFLRGKECKACISPYAVFVDEKNYFEPDMFVVCDGSKYSERGCEGAPDWTVEIVSPSSFRTDYWRKLFKYHEIGVREYWIVDPARRIVCVYFWEAEDFMKEYSFDELIPVRIYDGELKIRIADYGF